MQVVANLTCAESEGNRSLACRIFRRARLLLGGETGHDFLAEVVADFGVIAGGFVEGCFGELVFAGDQALANPLLDARVIEIALAGGLLGNDLQDAEAFLRFDDVGHGAGLEAHDELAEFGVGFVEGAFAHEAEVAAIGGGLGIFGKVGRQGAEVLSAFEALLDHGDLCLGLGFRLRLIILEIAHGRVVGRGDQNLGQMNLRLWQIEVCLVGVEVILDVLIGDVDQAADFFVEQFFDRKLAADLALEVIDGHLAGGQLLLKVFLGIGRLHLVDLGVDVGVGGEETELLGLLEHDFVVDEDAQEFQFLHRQLVVADAFVGTGELKSKLFVEVGVGDGLVVNRCGHVRRRLAVAARYRKSPEQGAKKCVFHQEPLL